MESKISLIKADEILDHLKNSPIYADIEMENRSWKEMAKVYVAIDFNI